METLINLIIAINKVYDNYMCDCGCSSSIIDEFNDTLNKLYKEDLKEETLRYIASLNTDIFKDEYYFTKEYKINPIRIKIANFLNDTNEVKEIKLDYNLVLKYISKDYRLAKYLDKLNKEDLCNISIINPKVLYLYEDIDLDIIKKVLENNKDLAYILDGLMDDCINTYIYNNKDKYLSNEYIYELYIKYLLDYLKKDYLKYPYLSKLARNDLTLASYVLDKDSKLIVYTLDKIRKNKHIMLKALKDDIENKIYLHENLLEDEDILFLINN